MAQEYRQNESYETIKRGYSSPTIEVNETESNSTSGNKYSLPYGLCKGVGIDTTGMTPREAWDAYTSKTGISKQDAEKEHWGKEAGEKNAKKNHASGESAKPDKQHEQAKETHTSASVESKNASIQQTEEQPSEAQKDRKFTATRHGVNEELAQRSREMNSFSDYKNGSATAEYNSDVQRFENNVNELIERYKSNDTLTEEDWAEVESIAEKYSANLARYTDEKNRVEASYPAWFISGPANYNTRKNDAKNSRLRSLYQENENRLDPNNNVYLKKINDILSGSNIKSNDSNAIGKLQKKYDDLKAELENGKAMNAYFRKNKTLVGFPGISEESAKAFDAKNASGDYFASQPFASYRLQNGNAELRRIQGRIDELKSAQSAAEAAKANPEAAAAETAARYPKVEGVEVQENAEEMRVQLRFPGKPDDETRTLLKSYGFRWSPTQGAWQRQLTGNGKYAAKQIMQKLSEKGE